MVHQALWTAELYQTSALVRASIPCRLSWLLVFLHRNPQRRSTIPKLTGLEFPRISVRNIGLGPGGSTTNVADLERGFDGSVQKVHVLMDAGSLSRRNASDLELSRYLTLEVYIAHRLVQALLHYEFQRTTRFSLVDVVFRASKGVRQSRFLFHGKLSLNKQECS